MLKKVSNKVPRFSVTKLNLKPWRKKNISELCTAAI